MDEKPPRLPLLKRNSEGRDPRFPMRVLLLWLLVLVAIPLMLKWKTLQQDEVREIPYAELEEKLAAGVVKSATVVAGGGALQTIRGEFYETITRDGETVPDKSRVVKFTTKVIYDDKLRELFKQHNVPLNFSESSQFWSQLMMSLLPFVLFVLLLYFLFLRQIKMAGKGAMSFGKSRARLLSRDRNKVTFKDVAGMREAKEEVEEIIQFLKDPKKFQRLGGRIPKGVLMVGPPGTGKTLLAKAIAGEANVPFFSISGSDFVEMFVGVGASRVRDMFEQGKKHAPCIIFIDEIDAVGRQRGAGLGGGHDEREQTLNALLVEMDGFDTQEGVIIIAATNRPDVLDSALLRPGRFDRQIVIDMPDLVGREEILRVHAKSVKLSKDVDLKVIARGTPGFSGADLANLINEAALLAARRDKKAVGMEELEEARDKVRWGRERRSRALDEQDKKITAYHEAGHALVMAKCQHTEPLHKVTIIPRGMFLGATFSLPEKDRYSESRNHLLDQITGIMGGRIAEEVIFGDYTSGAAGDIRQATHIARKMVTEWGMSEKIGMVNVSSHEEHMFLGRDLFKGREISEQTAREIDEEVRRIIEMCYNRAREIILQNKDKLIALAEALLEHETLDGAQIMEIIETGKLSSPPPRAAPPTQPPAQTQPTASVVDTTVVPAPGIDPRPASA
ncbi:MAG: ATP-dependent zinc metalloprotease FtsH [Verrucomicrobiae bacterium]|nr:ATP-dependent zinc metalloprotease FtsH [Verrucomicrobiae bacterium]MDW8343405.1 ATP-dependent zinc metalloprotease FtsH [Verrucomicrobiae bacterium]